MRYNELVLLLADEVASLEQEFEYEQKRNEERVAIERDACLAPAGEEWRLLLRREEALDRAIDRKIKLLLTLRKTAQRARAAELRSAPANGMETGKSACPTPAEESTAEDRDEGAPVMGAQADARGGNEGRPDGDVNEQPSPLREVIMSIILCGRSPQKPMGSCPMLRPHTIGLVFS